MSEILITGHKGYIGSHLVPKLKKLGYDVYGADIKDGEKFDIREEGSVIGMIKTQSVDSESIESPDIIIHLAARTGVRDSILEPEDYFRTNITGTYLLLKYATEYNVKKVLVASSSSVYGNSVPPLNEEMRCDSQLSPYAVSKRASELVCKLFPKLEIVVFRPFTVYGGDFNKMRKDMVVYKLINAARNNEVFEKYGKGDSIRGYTHIDDLCDGIIKLIDYKPKNNFEIFNLGGVEKIRLNDLIDIVKEEYPDLKVKQVPMPPLDVYQSWADISKAKKLLGWSPKRNFKEEIKKLCQQ